MPIERPASDAEFTVWPDADYAPSLGIESARLRDCVLEVVRRGLRGVFGTNPYFREETLDFLADLPALEAVAFWDVPLRDISGLYGLTHLKYLRLSERRPPLDLALLSTLRTMVWNHVAKDTGVGALVELERLDLWGYRPRSGSFEDLDLPASLTELRIFWADASSLEGLQSLPKLTTLEVSRCRNLVSLGSLAESCPNLETLLISSSGRLAADEARRVASSLRSLRHLVAGNQLIVDPDAT